MPDRRFSVWMQFLRKLSSGLPKARRRFVAEVIYRTAAKGSVRLSEIAHVLEKPIAMNKTVARLSSRLGYKQLSDHLTDRIIEDASSRIREDTFLILDHSEVAKKYAKKMPYVDTVRDGSEGRLSGGYWTCDGVAAEVSEPDIVPLYHEHHSTIAPILKARIRRYSDALRGYWGRWAPVACISWTWAVTGAQYSTRC